MVEFRCYCLGSDNKIIRGDSVLAEDVTTAIEIARTRFRSIGGAHPDRIEVWQGERRLHP